MGSDTARGPKRERSLSVGSKEILAYRREQEMRQQRELDKLKGVKVEESEVKEVSKEEEDSDSETEWKKSKPLAEKLRLQALKTLRSRTESGRSRSPSQNKKAADGPSLEDPADSHSSKKKTSKVSKELDEERRRVENQVKESLQKLNKDSEETMHLLTNLDSAKKRKKQKKEESDSESDESEKEKRKKRKAKKEKESEDSDSDHGKKKKKKRGRNDSGDDSDSEAEKKKKIKKKAKKEESEDSDSGDDKKKKSKKAKKAEKGGKEKEEER